MLLIRLAVFIFASMLILLQCSGDDSASLDGSFPLKNGTITKITDYNRMDQCMAEPGYFHMHHNSLVIFLQDHEFCGGGPRGEEGLLICHKSQLDEKETMARGLKATRQFELENVPGNAVAKRCEEAGHPNWHGMLIYTNDQGQWVIKFSTTNRTFVIPKTGSEPRMELLFYKLASAKDGGESFLSKTFGPKRDFMEWNKRDGFGVAEEAANRIRQPENEQLKKLFMELVKHQALLRNYVGIWSLGLDMLPTDENVYHLDLYTEKSECCKNIQIFYNLPTAQSPDPEKKNVQFEDGPIEMYGNFFENFTRILDGKVKDDAEYLIFEMVDLFQPEDKAQGMRLTINFKGNSIIFEQKINKKWDTVKETKGIKHHFGKGVPFHLVFILHKNYMIANMNCYGPVPLPAGKDIAFENAHRITINGGFEYDKKFEIGTLKIKNAWNFMEGISAKNSDGIVLRGKVHDENPKKFSIKLWNKGEDGFYEAILELTVDIMGRTIKYSEGKNAAIDVTFENGKPLYDAVAVSPFEILIQFKNESFDIWMNNSKINQQYNTTAGYGVVNYVQILGDASGDMIQIQKTPMECKFRMSVDKTKDALNITGKVLKESGASFDIELKYKDNNVPVLFNAVFVGDHNSTVTLTEKIGGLSSPVKPKELQNVMKIGEDFHLKFQYREKASEILVAINGIENIFTSKGEFDATNQYSISGDILVLDEPSTPCVPVPPVEKEAE